MLDGRPLPQQFSVRGLDYAGQGELERLLGGEVRRKGEMVVGTFPSCWCDSAAWSAIFAALEHRSETQSESVDTFLTRLTWQKPEVSALVSCLKQTPEVLRFLRNPAHRELWRKMVLGFWRYQQNGVSESTTLSQLGADWLNDSKSLRAGPLRRQLELLVMIASGRDIDPREALATYGILDNPYTSSVTIFAPLSFTLDSGERFDFPNQLFSLGQATMLPAETVQRIRQIEWLGDSREIITSENAAPFAQYVSAGHTVLYTAGYPNLAVQRLLMLLAEAGVVAVHDGDADLDGFRIAAMVGRCLPIRRVRAAEVIRNPAGLLGIPLTANQRDRAESILSRFPALPYAEEIALMLKLGCWFEQESFVED